jgi:hypothetical protein
VSSTPRYWLGSKSQILVVMDIDFIVTYVSNYHIYISTSLTHTSDLSPFFEFSNICPFSYSQIGVQFSNLWPFLTFFKPTSNGVTDVHMYAIILTLTNKSAIDLKIWKGRWYENILKFGQTDICDNRRCEEWAHIWERTLIYHIYMTAVTTGP